MSAVLSFFKDFVGSWIFLLGLVAYSATGKTYRLSYLFFRNLFVRTNGKVNDFLSGFISVFSKPKDEAPAGILGVLSERDVESIVEAIRQNGYYEFGVRLDSSDLEELTNFGQRTAARYINLNGGKQPYSAEKIVFDQNNPIAPRYQFDTSDVVQIPIVRRIIFDPTFRVVASQYLQCQPILDIITMWWSAPFKNKGTSESAQMYHFDMDRFKFLKFFFYVTDVHSENGPHCYIKGSHQSIPRSVRKDVRLTDASLKRTYNPKDFKEFTGSKGTVLAVDTRGLHKGKPLTRDNRLLLQIQFSNSLFGAGYEKFKIKDLSIAEKSIMEENSRTFQLIRA